MNFAQKLDQIIQKNNSCVCVGLDSEYERLPDCVKNSANKAENIFAFNKAIIDQTYDLVCAYKPNAAFYESAGAAGWEALAKTLAYIKEKNPELITIIDAKRGDIGNTNANYCRALLEDLDFDAITLQPYLGKESLEPFWQKKDKGMMILVHTSNQGAGELQNLECDHPRWGKKPLYQIVAHQVAEEWNENNNMAIVAGATYPEELGKIRQIINDLPMLIPGVGKQKGDVEKTIRLGADSNGRGMIINSSRSIIFADSSVNFAKTARKKTLELKNIINEYRKK